jgi:hypothetical protein
MSVGDFLAGPSGDVYTDLNPLRMYPGTWMRRRIGLGVPIAPNTAIPLQNLYDNRGELVYQTRYPRPGPLTGRITALGIPVHSRPLFTRVGRRSWFLDRSGSRSALDTVRVLAGNSVSVHLTAPMAAEPTAVVSERAGHAPGRHAMGRARWLRIDQLFW